MNISPRLAPSLSAPRSLLAALPLLALACQPLPGETSESEGSSSTSTTTGGATDQTASVTISTTAPSTGSSSSDGSTSTTTTSATTGGGICPIVPGFSCGDGAGCGEKCGLLESSFDDDGCLRTSCTSDRECAGDETCFGAPWGACTSSTVTCEEVDGACECASTDDCGGGFCVPTSALPAAGAAPAGSARVDDACAPNDGPAVELHFGLAEPNCKPEFPRTLNISVWSQGAPLPAGHYPIGEEAAARYDKESDGTFVDASAGWLKIDAWGATVSGSYAIIVGGELLEDSFVDLEYCGSQPACG